MGFVLQGWAVPPFLPIRAPDAQGGPRSHVPCPASRRAGPRGQDRGGRGREHRPPPHPPRPAGPAPGCSARVPVQVTRPLSFPVCRVLPWGRVPGQREDPASGAVRLHTPEGQEHVHRDPPGLQRWPRLGPYALSTWAQVTEQSLGPPARLSGVAWPWEPQDVPPCLLRVRAAARRTCWLGVVP